jgi:hypothetical protein
MGDSLIFHFKIMAHIIICGSQITVENSKYRNQKPYVLKIAISSQLNVILATQTKDQYNDSIYHPEVPVNFDLQEKYQLFIEDVDFSKDGSSHYIDYKSEA